MPGDSFVTRLANDVLEASERIVTTMEEGISILFDGTKSATTPKDSSVPMDEDELFMDDGDMESPLPGIAKGVLDNILTAQAGPQTPLEHFHAFRSAITWTEPFILALLLFHFVVFCTCFWVTRPRRGLVPRLGFMVVIAALVKSAERLNKLGAMHWEEFATQNYFDRNGIFVGTLFCGPLLLVCFVMLIMYLREASKLLIEVKREEVKRKKQKQKGRDKKSKSAKKKD